MSEKLSVLDPKRPTVRPRQAWGGIAVAIVGLGGVSLGLMVMNAWLDWVSGALLVAGLLTAWHGGVAYDMRAQASPRRELHEVRAGDEHAGVSSQAHVVEPRARATAEAVTKRSEAILARGAATPPRSWRRPASYGLVVLGAWLFLAQWFLSYPFTPVGQTSALRDTGVSVVLVLCGLRLRLRAPSRATSTVVALTAVLLILAVFLAHDSALTKWDEAGVGVLALCLGSATVVRR